MLLATVITYIYFLSTQANTYKSNKAPGHNISVEIDSYNGLYVDYDHSLFGYGIIEDQKNKFVITAPLIDFNGNEGESQPGEIFDCNISTKANGSFAMTCSKKAGLVDLYDVKKNCLAPDEKLILTKLYMTKVSPTDFIVCTFDQRFTKNFVMYCRKFDDNILNLVKLKEYIRPECLDMGNLISFGRSTIVVTLLFPKNVNWPSEHFSFGKFILRVETNDTTSTNHRLLYWFQLHGEHMSHGVYMSYERGTGRMILDLTDRLTEPSHHFDFNKISFTFEKTHHFVFSNPYAHQNKGEIVFFVKYGPIDEARHLNISVGDYYGAHYGFSVCRLNQIIMGIKELVILVLAPYGGRFRNGAIHMNVVKKTCDRLDKILEIEFKYLYKIELSDYFSDIDGIDTIACRIFNSDINYDGQDDILISTTSKWLSIKTIINSRVVSISYDFTWTFKKDTECDKAIENYFCVKLEIEMYFDTLFDEIFDDIIETNLKIEVPITIKFPFGYLQSLSIKNDGNNLDPVTFPAEFIMITGENKFKSTAVIDFYLKRNIFSLQVIRQRKMDAHLDMDRFFDLTVTDKIEANYHVLSIKQSNNQFESEINICDFITCLLGGKDYFDVVPISDLDAKIDNNIMVIVSGTLPFANNDDTKPYWLKIHLIFNEKYLQFLHCNGTQIQLSQFTKQSQAGIVNVKMILLGLGPDYNCKFKIKEIKNENFVWQKITVHMFTLENSHVPIKIISAKYSVNPTLDVHYALNRFTYTNNFNIYGNNSLSIVNQNEIEVQIFGPSIFDDIMLIVKVSTDLNNKLAYIHQYQCLDAVEPTILCQQEDCAFENSMEFNCSIPPANKFAHTKVLFVIKIRKEALSLVKFNYSQLVYVNAQMELNRDITYIGEPLNYVITLENKMEIKEVYNVIPTVCPEVKLTLKGWAIVVVFASAVVVFMVVFITLYHFDFLQKFIFTPSMLRLRADAKKQANIIIL